MSSFSSKNKLLGSRTNSSSTVCCLCLRGAGGVRHLRGRMGVENAGLPSNLSNPESRDELIRLFVRLGNCFGDVWHESRDLFGDRNFLDKGVNLPGVKSNVG